MSGGPVQQEDAHRHYEYLLGVFVAKRLKGVWKEEDACFYRECEEERWEKDGGNPDGEGNSSGDDDDDPEEEELVVNANHS